MRGEFLDIAGSRLYYYAAGSRGVGVPIVLLHGFATSGHLWTDVVPALPDGHRVVVLDSIGHGRSDPGRPGRIGMLADADAVVGVLDQLRIERACLAGHGTGGGVAQVVAMKFPHRVSHLCLAASIHLPSWPGRRARLAQALGRLARYAPSTWVRATVRAEMLRGYDDHERGTHDVDVFLRPFGNATGRDQLLAQVEAVTGADARELASRIGEIRVPTAVVWGARDALLPVELGRALAAGIPGSTLAVVDGVNHFLPAEAAQSVAVAVRDLLRRT